MLFVGLVLTLVGYAAAILIMTSQRVRMIRLVLAIAIGTGTLRVWRCGRAMWSGSRGCCWSLLATSTSVMGQFDSEIQIQTSGWGSCPPSLPAVRGYLAQAAVASLPTQSEEEPTADHGAVLHPALAQLDQQA